MEYGKGSSEFARFKRFVYATGVLITTGVLAACGGGGDGGSVDPELLAAQNRNKSEPVNLDLPPIDVIRDYEARRKDGICPNPNWTEEYRDWVVEQYTCTPPVMEIDN